MRAWRRQATLTAPPPEELPTFLPSGTATSVVIGVRRVNVGCAPELLKTDAPFPDPADFEMFRSPNWIAANGLSYPVASTLQLNFPAPANPAPTRIRYNGTTPYQFNADSSKRLSTFDFPIPFP